MVAPETIFHRLGVEWKGWKYSRATMEGRNTLRTLQKYNKTISTINVDCIDITFSRYNDKAKPTE